VINFRYHVVSIVSVFLALAIGIVLGSTALQGTTFNVLRSASASVHNQYEAAKAKNSVLGAQVNADQALAQATAPQLLRGLLAGQRVVLVNAPGAAGSVVAGITSALHEAGAAVTGQINLQPKLLDASQNTQQFLTSLAQQLAPAGAVPANGTGLQQAAKVLGSAILTKNAPAGSSTGSTTSSKPSSSGQAVLASYAQAGLLSIGSGDPSVPATLAVVITPASPPASLTDSDPANQGLITLAQQLNTAGLGTVMAGSASGSVAGSAIDALRNGNAGGQISSVDNADTATGQIVAVWALQQALTGHKVGSYGTGPGNTAAVPTPAPVPSGSAASVTTGSGTSPRGRG
jgi:hypothetical protein